MKIGKTQTEKDVTSIQESRDIVKEIIKFGVTEQQKLDVLYFLSLEVENRQLLEKLTLLLKLYRSKIKPNEESEYDNKESTTKDIKKLLGM